MNLTIDAAPALRCLAREYAGRFAADQTSPPPHAAWSMAHHCGYWSVPKRPIMLTAENLDQIEAYLKGLPDNILQGEVGIGVVAGPENKTTAALLIPKGNVHLKTISRTGTLKLEGRMTRGDGQLECWLQDRPGGMVTVRPIQLDQTGRFSLTLPEPAGAHRVELSRKTGLFRETIALLHRGPRKRRYQTYERPQAPPTSGLEPAAVVKAFNRYRAQQGLPVIRHEVHLNGPLNAWLNALSVGKLQQLPPGILDARGTRYADLSTY